LKLLLASGRRAGDTGERGDRHFTGDRGGCGGGRVSWKAGAHEWTGGR
jgi:hypothetical protein